MKTGIVPMRATAVDAAPWDVPKIGFGKRMLLHGLSLALFLLFLHLLMLWLLAIFMPFISDTMPRANLLLLCLAGWAGVAVAIGALAVNDRIAARFELVKTEQAWQGKSFEVLPRGGFGGDGQINIDADGLHITAKLRRNPHAGTDLLIGAGVLVVNAALVAACIWILENEYLRIASFCFAPVLYFSYRFRTRSCSHTLTIRPEDIRKLRCDGPIVTLKLCDKTPRGLRDVSFFVGPQHRRTFFEQFDRAFPGHLPPSYTQALAQSGLAATGA